MEEKIKNQIEELAQRYLEDMDIGISFIYDSVYQMIYDSSNYSSVLSLASSNENLDLVLNAFWETGYTRKQDKMNRSFLKNLKNLKSEAIKAAKTEKLETNRNYQKIKSLIERTAEEAKKKDIPFAIYGGIAGEDITFPDLWLEEHDEDDITDWIEVELSEREYIIYDCNQNIEHLIPIIKHQLRMLLVYQVTFFEACITNMMKMIFQNSTYLLENKEKVFSMNDILSFSDFDEFIKFHANKKASKWNGRMDKLEDLLGNKKININLQSSGKWREFRKFYSMRNVIVHCSGKYDKNAVDVLGLDESYIDKPLELDLSMIHQQNILTRYNIDYIRKKLFKMIHN